MVSQDEKRWKVEEREEVEKEEKRLLGERGISEVYMSNRVE